jgi:hypothetical protein
MPSCDVPEIWGLLMRRARLRLVLPLSLAALLLPGCLIPSPGDIERAAKHAMQRCTIDSEPPGATARINGHQVGKTPCDVARPFGDGGRNEFEFTVTLHGYRSEPQRFGSDFPTHVRFVLEPLPGTGEPPQAACDPATLPRPSEDRTVAVLDFQVDGQVPAGIGQTLADFARESARACPGLILVDREHMRAILTEEDFAATFKCDDTQCLVDFGRKLQAQLLIHGRVTQVGRTRVLTLKIIDVSTAAVLGIHNEKTTAELEQFLDLARPATCRLLRDALPAPPPPG